MIAMDPQDKELTSGGTYVGGGGGAVQPTTFYPVPQPVPVESAPTDTVNLAPRPGDTVLGAPNPVTGVRATLTVGSDGSLGTAFAAGTPVVTLTGNNTVDSAATKDVVDAQGNPFGSPFYGSGTSATAALLAPTTTTAPSSTTAVPVTGGGGSGSGSLDTGTLLDALGSLFQPQAVQSNTMPALYPMTDTSAADSGSTPSAAASGPNWRALALLAVVVVGGGAWWIHSRGVA